MALETLVYSVQEATRSVAWLREFLYLVPVAAVIPLWLRRKLKEEKSGDPNDPDLEIDHIKPIYRGGNGEEKNLQAVTLPEHAEKHFKEALAAKSTKIRRAEHWSVGAIVRRMSPKELEEFNDWLANGCSEGG